MRWPGWLLAFYMCCLLPTFNVIYPRHVRFGRHWRYGETDRTVSIGHTFAISRAFSDSDSCGCFFSEDFIYLWTGNLELSSSVAPIISLLLLVRH